MSNLLLADTDRIVLVSTPDEADVLYLVDHTISSEGTNVLMYICMYVYTYVRVLMYFSV